jgi:hypothetical protein
MAMVIMFGLLSSTILNLVAVPIFYHRFGRPTAAPVVVASAPGRSTGPDADQVPAS